MSLKGKTEAPVWWADSRKVTRPDAGLCQLRHVAGTQWDNKKYMKMKHQGAAVEDTSIAG